MTRRYVIETLFSEGAQSRLYAATDIYRAQSCILKTGENVKQETLLALQLNHPYVAQPFDFGVHPEIGTFAAYPKFSEPSFRRWSSGNPGDEDFRRAAAHIAELVAFLHHRGWLYHDFKPEHFLVGPDSIRVLDLGLCTRINESCSLNTFSGTFPYISPERLLGRPTDVRSDLFAFGMLLLHGFFANEDWSQDPSIPALHEIPKRCSHLPDPWRNLVT